MGRSGPRAVAVALRLPTDGYCGDPASPGRSILGMGPGTPPASTIRARNSSGGQALVGMIASFPRPAGITRMVPLSTCRSTKSRMQGASESTVSGAEFFEDSYRPEGREGWSGLKVGLPVPGGIRGENRTRGDIARQALPGWNTPIVGSPEAGAMDAKERN